MQFSAPLTRLAVLAMVTLSNGFQGVVSQTQITTTAPIAKDCISYTSTWVFSGLTATVPETRTLQGCSCDNNVMVGLNTYKIAGKLHFICTINVGDNEPIITGGPGDAHFCVSQATLFTTITEPHGVYTLSEIVTSGSTATCNYSLYCQCDN